MGIEEDPCLYGVRFSCLKILDYGEHLTSQLNVRPCALKRIESLPSSVSFDAFQKEVEMGGAQHKGRLRGLLPKDLFRMPYHFQAVRDPLKVGAHHALHFQGNTVLEEIGTLNRKLRPQLAKAVRRILAVSGASEIHPRIDDLLLAAPASSSRLILEKLDLAPAMGAVDIEDVSRLPVPHILPRALHGFFLIQGEGGGEDAAAPIDLPTPR